MISNITNDLLNDDSKNDSVSERLEIVPSVKEESENLVSENEIFENRALKENTDDNKSKENDNITSDYESDVSEDNLDAFDVRVSDPEIVIYEERENDSYEIGNRPSFPETKTDMESDNFKSLKNSTSKNSNDTSSLKSEKEIVDEYVTKFSDLRKEFNLNIDNLVDAAKEEYYGIDHDKRGQFVKDLSEKYLGKAIALENNSNEKFYDLLEIMEKDLKENQCSLESIKMVEDTFVKEKRAKKNELMSKAMQILQ